MYRRVDGSANGYEACNVAPFSFSVCPERKDSVCPAGDEMSTKRKAESHSRTVSRPRVAKSGGSRVESERDSGFSGLKGWRSI